jgi:hypothetical protein
MDYIIVRLLYLKFDGSNVQRITKSEDSITYVLRQRMQFAGAYQSLYHCFHILTVHMDAGEYRICFVSDMCRN